MNPDLLRTAPIFIAAVALFIVVVIVLGIRREGQRHTAWTQTRGQLLAVDERVGRLDDGQTDAAFHTYYRVQCSYRVADGRVLTSWADRRYNQPPGRPGDQVPLWYDPRRPEAFTVLAPMSTARAGLAYAPFVLFAAAVGAVALLAWRRAG